MSPPAPAERAHAIQRYAYWCRKTHRHDALPADDGELVMYADHLTAITEAVAAERAKVLKEYGLVERK